VLQKAGKHPIWNKEIQFNIDSTNDHLRISCFDKELFNDDLVGDAKGSVNKLLSINCIPLHYKNKKAGDLFFNAKMSKLDTKELDDTLDYIEEEVK